MARHTHAVRGTDVAYGAICLRKGCAVRGSDAGTGRQEEGAEGELDGDDNQQVTAVPAYLRAMRPPLRTYPKHTAHGMIPGTHIESGALTWRMVLCACMHDGCLYA